MKTSEPWRAFGLMLFAVGFLNILMNVFDMIRPGRELISISKATVIIISAIYCQLRSKL